MIEAKYSSYYQNSRADLYRFLQRSTHQHLTRILNVGCAAGFDAAILRDIGAKKIVGIEPVATAANIAAEQYDEVFNGSFDEWKADDEEKFDLIVFADVLEHMVNPYGALRRTRGLLTKDGYLLVSVPNVRHISVLMPLVVGGDWRYTPEGILDRTHLRFFTARSFTRAAEIAGFKVVAMQRWGAVRLAPLILLDRIAPFLGEFTRTQIFYVLTAEEAPRDGLRRNVS